jgi:hypothetical protein
VNEQISRRLREAAEAHQPDRGRILARVQRGTTGTARATGATFRHRTPGIGRSWPNVALAGLAAAGILAAAGLAVAAIVQTAPPNPDNATSLTMSTPSGTPTSAPSTSTSPPGQGLPAPTYNAPPPTSTPPPDDRTTDGPLSSEGSIDPHSHTFWTQNNLTLTTTEPLTALTVELRIAQTGNVQSSGQWQTGPDDDFTITVEEVDGTLIHRWTLKPGHTAPAAQHTFAAQYNHPDGPRDPHPDTYRAEAGPYTVHGHFTPSG